MIKNYNLIKGVTKIVLYLIAFSLRFCWNSPKNISEANEKKVQYGITSVKQEPLD